MTNDIRKLMESLDRIAAVKESSDVRPGTELMINGRPADLDALVDQHEDIGPALAFGTDADAEEALNDVLGDQDWALIDSETGEVLANNTGAGSERAKSELDQYRKDRDRELERFRRELDTDDSDHGEPIDKATARKMAQQIIDRIGNSFPDGDPADAVMAVMQYRTPGDRGYEKVMDVFRDMTGAEDAYDYYDQLTRDFGS